jgi:RNA polymerase sigma factor (sigma-70 family)
MDGIVPTVFVVDDDEHVRRALARLLRSLGMQVVTFASAREFLSCGRPDGPACLILDVRLPGENGLLVPQSLQAAAWSPPLIFLTGYGTIPMAVQAMKAGAVDFLQKPVDDDALLAAVATALEQDHRLRDRQRSHAALHQRFATLTPREREVMALMITGLLNKEIACALGTSEKTIKVHRARLKEKMQALSLAELVRMAAIIGMGEPPSAELLRLPQRERQLSPSRLGNTRPVTGISADEPRQPP